MIINNNKINIFDPKYAFCRITADDFFSDKYSALQHLVETFIVPEPVYNEGDNLDYRERDYHKYPENIAVLVEKDGVFGLQTFSDGKVGKFFCDIIEQSDEVYKFFMKAEDKLIVLENNGGRELTNSYDLLIKYVWTIQESRKKFDENKDYIYKYIDRLHRLMEEKRNYPDSNVSATFEVVEKAAEDFLVEMQDMLTRANQSVNLEIEEIYHSLSDDEIDCIALGLYYTYLKNFQYVVMDTSKPKQWTPFMSEMHAFIKNHPGIVDKYCDYMDYPRYERDVVKLFLHNEGMTKDRWISAADDLL